MKIREKVAIAELTTMRLGGLASYVVEIEQPRDIKAAYAFAADKGLPTFILGRGANTLGLDEGFAGVILHNKLRGMEILEETAESLTVQAMGGEEWDDLVALVTERGFSGVEALSAIPGTVGAAPVQNIGAYGQEFSQTVSKVEVYDCKTQKISWLTAEECQFAYRRSIFNYGEQRERYFIVSVILKLEQRQMQGPFYNSLQAYIDEHDIKDFAPAMIRKIVRTVRAAKLPDPAEEASAGSFFKNVYLTEQEATAAEAKGIPVWRSGKENKVNSGWLIEQVGLKGRVLHGIKINDKAALVLINQSAKTYADLALARQEICDAVYKKFGYHLKQEPVELK